MRVGIQPFTISAIDEPLPAKLDRIARAGFQGVEVGTDANTDAVHEKLATYDLRVSSIASGFDDLDTEFDAHVAAAEDFGISDVGIMWADPEEFESRESVEDFAAKLDDCADRLADHGLQLHYHNHDHEFTDFGETDAFEVLVDETDQVRFEIDLGWAGVAGADPPELLREVGDRVSHVHCKDMNFRCGDFVTIGEGDLDVAETLAAAEEVDLDWLIYENDDPTDPVTEPAHASVVLDEFTDHYC
jgi:sugar phosphate isomerase/epimerase